MPEELVLLDMNCGKEKGVQAGKLYSTEVRDDQIKAFIWLPVLLPCFLRFALAFLLALVFAVVCQYSI